MSLKIIVFCGINICLSIVLLFLIRNPSESYSFIAGQTIFCSSFLAQVILVRRFLGLDQASTAGITNNSGFLVMMLIKFGLLGLSIWTVISYLQWPPVFFIGGLVTGLAVLAAVFYLIQPGTMEKLIETQSHPKVPTSHQA
jgi:hypothetical protein